MQKQPDPVDIHVGSMIRTRRKMIGWSQHRLAEELGLTFQQIQKYERGLNRISASKMHQAAAAMNCAPGYFFQGLPAAGGAQEIAREPAYAAVLQLAGAGGGIELAQRFLAMETHQQRAVINVCRAIVPDPAPSTLAA